MKIDSGWGEVKKKKKKTKTKKQKSESNYKRDEKIVEKLERQVNTERKEKKEKMAA